jgi:DNA-binding transcriptional MocR family regulator
VPGKAIARVERLKLMTSIATSLPIQDGVADYLRHGGFDHHLRALRREFERGRDRMLEAIARHFPDGTRATRPEGGYVLWAELPKGCDAMKLHRAALARGISIAPGPMFSARNEHRNCVRLNYGHPWTERTSQAIATLGRLVRS